MHCAGLRQDEEEAPLAPTREKGTSPTAHPLCRKRATPPSPQPPLPHLPARSGDFPANCALARNAGRSYERSHTATGTFLGRFCGNHSGSYSHRRGRRGSSENNTERYAVSHRSPSQRGGHKGGTQRQRQRGRERTGCRSVGYGCTCVCVECTARLEAGEASHVQREPTHVVLQAEVLHSLIGQAHQQLNAPADCRTSVRAGGRACVRSLARAWLMHTRVRVRACVRACVLAGDQPAAGFRGSGPFRSSEGESRRG